MDQRGLEVKIHLGLEVNCKHPFRGNVTVLVCPIGAPEVTS